MKTVKIEVNSKNIDLIDAMNTVLFEVHHDLREKGIQLEIHRSKSEVNEILLDQNAISFECHCQPENQPCHCSDVDKIRKALYKHLKLPQQGCCGGNCGCH